MRRIVASTFFFFLLLGLFLSAYEIRLTHATIVVPDIFLTIQEAINAANVGDTIFVRNGTYYENLYVNKTITLIGADKESTIIDGNFSGGYVLSITADNVHVENFTIRNPRDTYYGISMNSSESIINNTIITNTKVTGSLQGIRLWNSSNCVLANNHIFPYNNSYEESGGNAIRIFYSDENTITKNMISSHIAGIHLSLSENNVVSSNILENNWYGVRLHDSINNTIVANNISDNVQGVYIVSYYDPCVNNLIYHNNFVNNTNQATPHTHINIWNSGYPSGGNYWNDYNGSDLYKGPFQNITGSDGIGDTPYVIDENNTDNFPLMYLYPLYWCIADINDDLRVDIFDIVQAVLAYGTVLSDPAWDSRCDVAPTWNKIDIFDLVTIASYYGETYTP